MSKTTSWIDFAAALLPGAGIAIFYGGLYATIAATVAQSMS